MPSSKAPPRSCSCGYPEQPCAKTQTDCAAIQHTPEKTSAGDLTMFMCGPSKCDHDYSGWQPIMIDGKERGGTAVCSKCGRTAYEEAVWL